MPELEEIILEIPISSGESEKRSESCIRKKKKTTKLGSTNSGSQIPRSNSVHRSAGFKKPIEVVEKFQDSSKSLLPYRLKKSFSQMDMKMSKNNNNNNTSRYYSNFFHHQDNYNNYGTLALPKPVLKSKATDSNKTDFCPSKDSSLYYLVNEPECGEFSSKLAGMKIFATIMLNSWRNRRDEVRRLKEELEQLQRKVIKVKNQVHVLSSVFRNEQKQNEKLNRQLRHASQDIQRLQSTVENLTTSLISAKADASFFEQQFHAKEQENDSLNNTIVETNSQLFKSMTQVRQLQSSLSCEQRSVQELENQKNELLNEDVSGRVVLITGGGGGVGRLLALNFAKLNARVVIWDINHEALKTTIDLLMSNGFTCKGYVVDISDREQVYERAEQVKQEIGEVEVLINNAGVVCCKPFWDLPDRVIQNTYNINIISHYWTVKAFLPEMMKNNRGHIVTVGSVTGLLGTYGCTDYSATKFACNGFHESLYTDLRTHGYDNIGMTLVCPYYINTGMFDGVRPRAIPMLEPQYVADEITKAMRRNENWCVLPNHIRTLVPLKCLLPAKMSWELMSRVIRGPESMMFFRGRGRVAAG